jgi:uncharacterized DUF497 family protein
MADIEWTYRGAAFACNENKRRLNKCKHGIDLCGASAAFFDPYGFSYYDQEHSAREDRHCFIGSSASGAPLVVTYTLRQETIRLISARKASKQEAANYEKQYK